MTAGEKIKMVGQKYLRNDLPALEVGDVVKMRIKVKEADKMRVHPYEGTVIRKTGGGVASTFTVRKISFGEGVERTFPSHSPMIDAITIVSKGQVARARLYYLRKKIGKKARVKKELAAAS
ncbi:MAG: 50S ribosomal protein L19 [Candidatus Omnitrophota bacterium]